MSKITNGANDRPRDETIAQSGPGFPDDSSRPIETSEEEVKRVRDKLGVGDAGKTSDDVDEQLDKPQRGSA